MKTIMSMWICLLACKTPAGNDARNVLGRTSISISVVLCNIESGGFDRFQFVATGAATRAFRDNPTYEVSEIRRESKCPQGEGTCYVSNNIVYCDYLTLARIAVALSLQASSWALDVADRLATNQFVPSAPRISFPVAMASADLMIRPSHVADENRAKSKLLLAETMTHVGVLALYNILGIEPETGEASFRSESLAEDVKTLARYEIASVDDVMDQLQERVGLKILAQLIDSHTPDPMRLRSSFASWIMATRSLQDAVLAADALIGFPDKMSNEQMNKNLWIDFSKLSRQMSRDGLLVHALTLYDSAFDLLIAGILGHEFGHATGRCFIDEPSQSELDQMIQDHAVIHSDCNSPVDVNEALAESCGMRAVESAINRIRNGNSQTSLLRQFVKLITDKKFRNGTRAEQPYLFLQASLAMAIDAYAYLSQTGLGMSSMRESTAGAAHFSSTSRTLMFWKEIDNNIFLHNEDLLACYTAAALMRVRDAEQCIFSKASMKINPQNESARSCLQKADYLVGEEALDDHEYKSQIVQYCCAVGLK